MSSRLNPSDSELTRWNVLPAEYGQASIRLDRQLVGKSGSPQIFDNARDDCFVAIGLGLRKAPKRQAGIKVKSVDELIDNLKTTGVIG